MSEKGVRHYFGITAVKMLRDGGKMEGRVAALEEKITNLPKWVRSYWQ